MDDPTLDVPPPSGPRDDPFREGAVAARARRTRSLMIALALVAFVLIVFVVSIIKLAGHAI
jgi:hypothetical protein